MQRATLGSCARVSLTVFVFSALVLGILIWKSVGKTQSEIDRERANRGRDV